MRFSIPAAVLLLATAVGALEDTPKKSSSTSQAPPACTATAGSGGSFFDLRPDTAHKPDSAKGAKSGVTKDYHARGFDYGKNFTLNVCGAVVDAVTDVVGVNKQTWANVSAYYTSDDKTYSIGTQSMNLRSRGRKLVLQYKDGSPCGTDSKSKRSKYEKTDDVTEYPPRRSESSLRKPASGDSDKDEDPKKSTRRKSTTISFLCDRDQGSTQTTISFVGTDPDECAYFFEARSPHACAQAEPHKPGSVGPGSVFGLILVITVLVYIIGGVCYNRTVTHARGWRQLPNYSLWSGIWSFFSDMMTIGLASCARLFPGHDNGYRHLNSNYSSRNRNSDAENRLIDQLDEEWDD